MENNRAVVAVIGKDAVGILGKVATGCSEAGANVIEVTQSVLDGFFCMIMIVDMSSAKGTVEFLKQTIEEKVPEMKVHVMHENIFNSMHRI